MKDTALSCDALPDLALRFCLSHPAVATVIPGMRTPDHVRNNAATSDHELLSREARQLLRKHRWVRNFYSPELSMVDRMKAGIRQLSRA